MEGRAVRNERATVADLVNEHCDPDPPFHPGKLADTGIERAAKKRIPQGEFRARRAEIRAAPEKAAAIEASMYTMSAAERAPLHAERTARYEARKPEIDALKAVGQWPPKSQRRAQQERPSDSLPRTNAGRPHRGKSSRRQKHAERLAADLRRLRGAGGGAPVRLTRAERGQAPRVGLPKKAEADRRGQAEKELKKPNRDRRSRRGGAGLWRRRGGNARAGGSARREAEAWREAAAPNNAPRRDQGADVCRQAGTAGSRGLGTISGVAQDTA